MGGGHWKPLTDSRILKKKTIIFSAKNFWFFQETFFFVCTQSHPVQGKFWALFRACIIAPRARKVLGTFSWVHNRTPRKKIWKNQQKSPPGSEMNLRPLQMDGVLQSRGLHQLNVLTWAPLNIMFIKVGSALSLKTVHCFNIQKACQMTIKHENQT